MTLRSIRHTQMRGHFAVMMALTALGAGLPAADSIDEAG